MRSDRAPQLIHGLSDHTTVWGANEHRLPCAPLSGTSGASVASTVAVGDAVIAADTMPTCVGLTAAASLVERGGVGLAEGTCCGCAQSVATAALERTSSAGLDCVPGLGVPALL
ncbi:hypothetical protein NDU88_006817 [Pleurodeles waltl]|uniref:Uncharacterized protein n=1 Tax=Pleurodeles waltl TaxID=8319 RepID=A0AAV7PJH4_PLEWA|nr:hypothetical protein NDU88_006817 [Pleurodeles waltl]